MNANERSNSYVGKLLVENVSPGTAAERARREIDLRFEEVSAQFVWIMNGEDRVGLVDREEGTVELMAPHPGRPTYKPVELPEIYHAPTYQGGRIVLQWWITPGYMERPGLPLPVPQRSKKPDQYQISLGSERGKTLSISTEEDFSAEGKGSHEAVIFYDPWADSFAVKVRAELETTWPFTAEFSNFYAGGVYDNRPQYKRHQITVWAHPDGRVIRWPHNPVSYGTVGMRDAWGERRIADGGFLGYFADPYTNPLVEIYQADPPAYAMTCSNIHDEHLSCLCPSRWPQEQYHYEADYCLLSVLPEMANELVRRPVLVNMKLEPGYRDPQCFRADSSYEDSEMTPARDPQFPGFYHGRVNSFEEPIPLDQTDLSSLFWASRNPDNPVYWEENCGHTGRRSIRLRGDSQDGHVITRLAGGSTPHLSEKTRYRLSGWLKCESVEGRGARVRFDEIRFTVTKVLASHVLGPANGTCDWTYFETEFTTQPTSDNGWLFLELFGSGQAWFDDLALEECP